MNISIKILLGFTLILLSTSLCFGQDPLNKEVVPLTNTQLYYEQYGEGPPLIFLHGYSMSSKSWHPYIEDFATDYSVYLIDLNGHGQSKPFERTLSFEEVAHDLNELLNYLKLDTIQAIGFSFGGDVLYQLALLNPELIESMITIGALGTWTIDDFLHYTEIFNFENRENFPWLATMHSSEDQVKRLMAELLNYKVYLTDEELQSIQPEVMIMIGDDDEGMSFDEIARAKKNLSRSDVWILPNVQHGAHEGDNKEEFIKKAKSFLRKP